ncbi:MAG: histidinol-phosphate transaminase [Treponema sp.]|nr:histidinol-phosphate transaminase [Treponema sp.]MCL2237604.1 histidinol-phosphate transaminase [Treponema sp.]
MSSYWNERTKNLSPYVPGEQPKDRQFIKLNTNENPYPPSPKVIEAIKQAANDSLRLYPDPECTDFRKAVAQRYGVKLEQVFAGNGSDEILAFAFGAFFEKTILFPDITYSFYPVYADLWDIPYCPIPLQEDFSIQISDYKVPSDGVILPNPNAPTGIALSIEEILSIAEFMERQKKVLIIDEAYIAFGADSAVAYIEKNKNLLTVHTLSKSASLAGLRAGFAIGNEKLIEGLCRIRDSFNSYTLDRLALAGAKAAIEDYVYYDEINKRVINTRERTAKVLSELGFIVSPSSANFLFVKHPKTSGAELFANLRERGILARHFNKNRIADHLRVSIGTDDEMDKFLSACREIIIN